MVLGKGPRLPECTCFGQGQVANRAHPAPRHSAETCDGRGAKQRFASGRVSLMLINKVSQVNMNNNNTLTLRCYVMLYTSVGFACRVVSSGPVVYR